MTQLDSSELTMKVSETQVCCYTSPLALKQLLTFLSALRQVVQPSFAHQHTGQLQNVWRKFRSYK